MPAKKRIPAIENVEDLHAMIDDIAKIEVDVRSREAARDAEINAVRLRHDGEIETLKKTIKALVSQAEAFGLARRDSVFGKLKSSASKLARFGFREGNPTLCLLNKKWSWESVKAALKDKGMTDYVRTIEEVDKDKLKSSRLSDTELAAIGVRIDSKERFYVEPKSDEADRIVADNAAA